MKHLKVRILAALCALLLLCPCWAAMAEAAGGIELDKDCTLTVIYRDGETPIPGASFSLYKIADTDDDANMTPTAEFAGLGLNLSTDRDSSAWPETALQLKGEAQQNHTPMLTGETDEAGLLTFTVKPGLYYVIGSRTELDNDTAYWCDPFLAFVPAQGEYYGTWVYDVTAEPKKTSEQLCIGEVLKIWDPEYPGKWADIESVTVDILCDGILYQTVELTAENNWRYQWKMGLDAASEHDWTFYEHPVEHFEALYEKKGTTVVINNRYIPEVPPEEPPEEHQFVKQITGDTPSEENTPDFTFVMKANKAEYPMPEGSEDGVKTVKLHGAGSDKFGAIKFEQPGTYDYLVYEKKGKADGFTYDATVYTLTATVTAVEGSDVLNTVFTIKTNEGEEVKSLEFKNAYKAPDGSGEKLPQTGLLWWPVPLLLAAGVVLFVLGLARRKGDSK